jgi:hypothetical protein
MTYATSDETDSALPELPEGMRWVVAVDKRQIAVLLMENERPVASATENLERDTELDYEHQHIDAVEQVCRCLAAEALHQWGFLHGLKKKLGPRVEVRMRTVDWSRRG